MRLAVAKETFIFALRHPLVRRSIAGLMASIVLLVGVSVFYWWPARDAEESLNARIDDKRREISNAEFRAKLARVSGHAVLQVARMEKKLDASVTQVALVQNLAALARQYNVKIVSEAYEEGQLEEGYLPLVHGLTLQASYPELHSFIMGLEGMPTFTVVKGAIFGQTSGSSDVRVQLDMITYRKMTGPQT